MFELAPGCSCGSLVYAGRNELQKVRFCYATESPHRRWGGAGSPSFDRNRDCEHLQRPNFFSIGDS